MVLKELALLVDERKFEDIKEPRPIDIELAGVGYGAVQYIVTFNDGKKIYLTASKRSAKPGYDKGSIDQLTATLFNSAQGEISEQVQYGHEGRFNYSTDSTETLKMYLSGLIKAIKTAKPSDSSDFQNKRLLIGLIKNSAEYIFKLLNSEDIPNRYLGKSDLVLPNITQFNKKPHTDIHLEYRR